MSEFVYVPVEPTEEMRSAMQEANYDHDVLFPKDGIFRSDRIYKAMLAAAPTQPSPAESDKESVRNAALEDERAAFEDSERKRPEFSHHGEETITPYTGVNGEHEYLLPFVQQRWVGWQARASMKSQPAQPSDTET